MMSTSSLKSIKRVLSGPYWTLRAWLADAAKAAAVLVILRPAGDWLPRAAGLSLARLCGRLSATMSATGREKLRAVERTLVTDAGEAKRLTNEIYSRHFLDFLLLRRYLKGRENVDTWSIVEDNAHVVDELRRSNASYIVAMGHFARHATLALYLPRILPQQLCAIVAPPTPKSWHPRALWLRAHYGQMLGTIQNVRPDILLLWPTSTDFFRALVRRIRQPGNVLIMSVDAPWHKDESGSLSRPFAGRRSVTFATGTARLARLAQCPIVLCMPYVDDRGQVVLEWVRVIDPPDKKDAAADMAITDLLLDAVERAIGQRPDQYVMDFLGERRWNRSALRWEPAPSEPSSVAATAPNGSSAA